jgi:CO/xanthine dehydrogenase Mo-binding subunit
VHDELKPAGTFADLKHLAGRKNTNIALDYQLRRGDVSAAMASADHVLEHTFKTQQCMHTPLEPICAVAIPGEGALTIHSSCQTPSFVRMEIARLLGWPENKVSVRVPFLGGGFGAKVYVKVEALAAALALIARRPVKIALTMEEQFYTITKHATTFRIQKRHHQGWSRRRARMRRVLERRRLCRYRSARRAEIGFHGCGPVRHRERADRFLRGLHQPSTCRRAPRLRDSAARLGL